MECPLCRLTNLETAIRCDCGYNFQTGSIEYPDPSPAEVDLILQKTPLPRIWIGFALSGLILVSEFFDANSGLQQTGTSSNPAS